jgi:hypothetical protein
MFDVTWQTLTGRCRRASPPWAGQPIDIGGTDGSTSGVVRDRRARPRGPHPLLRRAARLEDRRRQPPALRDGRHRRRRRHPGRHLCTRRPGRRVRLVLCGRPGARRLPGAGPAAGRQGGAATHADLGDGQGGHATGSRRAPDRAARAVVWVGAARRSRLARSPSGRTPTVAATRESAPPARILAVRPRSRGARPARPGSRHRAPPGDAPATALRSPRSW